MPTLYECRYKYNQSLAVHPFEIVCKPTKAEKQRCFSSKTHCLSRKTTVAFKVMYSLFSLQSNSNLLNLVLSSMKWSLPYPIQDPKQHLKIKETLYIGILTFSISSIYGKKCISGLVASLASGWFYFYRKSM